jgi:hypothetical protein
MTPGPKLHQFVRRAAPRRVADVFGDPCGRVHPGAIDVVSDVRKCIPAKIGERGVLKRSWVITHSTVSFHLVTREAPIYLKFHF